MKRIKRHKIKTEKAEASYSREQEEHDLAYYIHDRVELMHQVFSILKYKELKAMAPECVRNLPIGDLQELCTEELLGISSKRLLATLDGAEPPSDTESSSASPSPNQMETISLDSISSDEEILSQSSKKKKHKHRRNSKSKSKKREKHKSKDKPADDTTELSKASRAGLTVLELLELQARARAIKAQLQNENAKTQSEAPATVDHTTDDDDEVEIKEEAPDVVEISSGDEKPDINALQAAVQKSPKPKETPKAQESPKAKEVSKAKDTPKEKDTAKPKETIKANESQKEPQEPKELNTDTDKESQEVATTVTKRVNDLIITVPHAKVTRKIKLNRNNLTVTVPTVTQILPDPTRKVVVQPTEDSTKEVTDKSKKKKKKKKKLEKDGSDHDEITLQLSDSEKMDLLEDLNEKNYDRLSSSSSDSDSSDEADSESEKSNHNDNKTAIKTDTNEADDKVQSTVENETEIEQEKTNIIGTSDQNSDNSQKVDERIARKGCNESNEVSEKDSCTDDIIAEEQTQKQTEDCNKENQVINESENAGSDAVADEDTGKDKSDQCVKQTQVEGSKDSDTSEVNRYKDSEVEKDVGCQIDKEKEKEVEPEKEQAAEQVETEIDEAVEKVEQKAIEISITGDIPKTKEETQNKEQELNIVNKDNENKESVSTVSENKESEKAMSEGEISDRESSEVEAVDIQPEVVCISDDEKKKKKKKKKDKKAKKEKKSKKSKQDFREGADENFYKDADKPVETNVVDTVSIDNDNVLIDITDDDVYEILELSDDSSCYEVEGTVLSKEPTAEEIEALSARIDEIKREDIDDTTVTDESKQTEENEQTKSDESETEYISWKDRYLDSKKVKKVLTTANILNAMRKKNIELKRKIEEAKKKEAEEVAEKVLEEGSIEQYQTLQGSSKYVNPVTESTENAQEGSNGDGKNEDIMAEDETVTREMRKDARKLMKMFKKLLNSKKIKRREKKKKRKMKKQLGGEAVPETAVV